MNELTLGILAGLGCGLNWAVTSLLVRTLLGRLTPAGIGALRATGGGGLLLGVALAAVGSGAGETTGIVVLHGGNLGAALS